MIRFKGLKDVSLNEMIKIDDKAYQWRAQIFSVTFSYVRRRGKIKSKTVRLA